MNSRPPIYLDYMSTTPLDPRVRQKMLAALAEENYGNYNSSHYYGRRAHAAIEEARVQVARLVHCQPQEIIWTSGATEANNLALKGIMEFYKRQGRHLITSVIEHKSVLECCKHLETQGYEVSYLGVSSEGLIDLEELKALVRPDTILVSIMHANNEIGTLQNLREIGNFTRSRGIIFHTDAAQSVGKVPIDLQELSVDIASFSAHKLYGPKGVGALYLRSKPKLHLMPQLQGGYQEQGVRAGTLPTHQIVGMGEAYALAELEMVNEARYQRELIERLWNGIQHLDHLKINGAFSPSARLPNNLNLWVGQLNGRLLLDSLPELACSTTSACYENYLPNLSVSSYVLRAIGLTPEEASCALRLSVGRFTRPAEIDLVVNRLCSVIGTLRAARG